MEKRNATPYGMLISSMLIFGTIGIFRKYIPLSSGLLACARGFLGALALFPVLTFGKKSMKENMGTKDLLLLILSGGVMGFNWILFFEACKFSVSVATLCYYMQPTIVILLSSVFLSERLTPKRILCAILGAAGMVLVSGILDQGIEKRADTVCILLGLGAAFLYAWVVILNKKVSGGSVYGRTVVQLLSAAVCLLPYLFLTEDFSALALNTSAIVCILVLGLVHTGLAYALYFGSIRKLKGQSVAVLSYIDPVSALILSALVLKEHMSIYGTIGAVLIIGTAIFGELHIPLGEKRKE